MKYETEKLRTKQIAGEGEFLRLLPPHDKKSFQSKNSRNRQGEVKMRDDRLQSRITNKRGITFRCRSNIFGKRNFLKMLFGLLALGLMTNIAALAQNVRNTEYKADQTLKSNARVNPSTLAMELSISVGGYPGRGEANLPVAFDYSSKVWRLSDGAPHQGQLHPITDTVPMYADKTAAGWTTGLGFPAIDNTLKLYMSDTGGGGNEGLPFEEPEDGTTRELYYIKRVYVTMPDGSSHEFRVSDAVIHCGDTSTGCAADLTGTFLSVDSTRMRLDISQQSTVLYLPDGSRYIFGQQGSGSFVDRSGNRMDYDAANRRWTDALGRIINDPLPKNVNTTQTQTVGDQAASFPGINGGTISATFSWRYLKDPNGGESGLNDPNQSLAYASNVYCSGGATYPIAGTNLFASSANVRVCGEQTVFNPVVLTKITLANGQSYGFKYNLYGEIEKIIYPAGGYERFAYTAMPMIQSNKSATYDQTNRGVSDRWVSAKGDGTDEIHWSYGAVKGTSQSPGPYKVIITAPDATRTEQLLYDEPSYTIAPPQPYGYGDIKSGRAYEERSYSATGELLRRHLTKYATTDSQVAIVTGNSVIASRDLRPTREINITFEPNAGSALAAMSETTYDTNSDAQYFASLNPIQSKPYNFIAQDLSSAQTSDIDTLAAQFSSSNLAKSAETDYLYDSNYKARNIVTLPIESRVKDAAGNVKAKSQTAYDEAAYPIISAGTDAQWTDPQTSYRGNVTTARSWTDVANNQFVETHAEFDNFGNLRKSWDGKGNLSETEYASTYRYAYPTKVTTPVPDSTGANGSSTAFETSVTYDLTTGLPLTTTDANGQMTSMEYNDSLLRPTKITPPSSGGQTVMEYTDTPGSVAVKTKTQIDANNWAESTVYADGLGRAVKSEKKDNVGNVFVETQYDAMGRVSQVSNPYRADEAVLWTQNTYDALSRVTKIKTPDNAEVNTAYDIATSGTLGTVVTVTDQAGKTRRSLTNALGQLARVDEPDDAGNLGAISSPNQATAYAYDTLNNLTTVVQGVQTRTFSYDALSRLKNAANPESGTISYSYDANGNLTQKTDARSIATSYVYDNLNRVKSRTYSDSTPAVSYFYDGTGLGGVPNYAKGKLTKVSSSVSETKYDSFDNVGKVLTNQQITDGNTYAFGYSYNLGGMLTEETYPSGRVVKNTIASDASLSKVETMPSGGSYATRAESFAYTAAGAVSSMKLGNNRWESAQFNSRLQPTQLGLGNSSSDTSLWKVNYDYGTTANNGNVFSQTITVPSINPLVQNYTYDSLNRLKSATETQNSSQTWKQTFVYDRYGNRQFDAANTTTLGSCPQAQCNPAVDVANNRFTTGQGYTYDLSGNLITDANGRSFAYDAENKQKTVSDASNTIGNYFYDGDGKRVKKVSSAETTVFAYDAAGKLAAEYLLTSATPQTPTTSYLTTDSLGSPRVITDQSSNIQSQRDFMPFGEEVTRQNYGTDSIRQKFTGYERDDESNLDFAQARYHNYNLGRFQSPDPLMASARRTNPQTFNRYSYSLNNPLKFVDPSGMLSGSTCPPVCREGQTVIGPDGTPWTYSSAQGTGTLATVNIVDTAQSMVLLDTPMSNPQTTIEQIPTTPPALGLLGPPPAIAPTAPVVAPGIGRILLSSIGRAAVTTMVAPAAVILALPSTAQAPTTARQPTTTTTDDEDEEGNLLYRGVTVGHPGYGEALLGIARPRGGTATPAQHNEDEDTRSPYTSWTRSYGIANYWANRSPAGGIILSARIPRSRQVASPDLYREQEVLVTGVVTGANVTLIKPK